jgi:diguanylate cyclase
MEREIGEDEVMLRLLRKTRESNGRELKDPTALLAELEQRSDFLMLTTRALLQLLSDYVLDLQEIKGAEIKKKLPELSDQLVSLDNGRRLHSAFDKARKEISDHARLQRQYLLDREAELKDVIDVLTKAMVELDSDNRRYNDNLLSRSDRMREITLLEDIRKIKASLTGELHGIRATIKEKQTRDEKKLELLSRQVRNLYGELEKARHDSQRDSLTGAYNRAAVDHYLAELLQRNAVSEKPFALLLIDIDNFKAINDTYGHPTGDRVIIAVITKCRSCIRKEDFLARYGGEEFVLVCCPMPRCATGSRRPNRSSRRSPAPDTPSKASGRARASRSRSASG